MTPTHALRGSRPRMTKKVSNFIIACPSSVCAPLWFNNFRGQVLWQEAVARRELTIAKVGIRECRGGVERLALENRRSLEFLEFNNASGRIEMAPRRATFGFVRPDFATMEFVR